MATMNDRRSVAANTTVDNVLAGKIFEFAQRNSIIGLYAQASAVGLNVSFIIGNEVQVDDQEVGAQNRLPIVPDDLITRAGALRGDRVVLRLRNTTAGAITAFTKVDVDPV
jgi:hypothetical protein